LVQHCVSLGRDPHNASSNFGKVSKVSSLGGPFRTLDFHQGN